jgi:peptidoglycan LD-endopeptidase CwlK
MAEAFLTACRAAGLDVLVTCTMRSMAEQTALYAQGRTTPGKIVTHAQAGHSAHNYGLALDVVPIVNGKPDWFESDPVWQQIGAFGEAAGLEWYGAPGAKFPELPHFQHPTWELLIQQVTT